METGTSTTATTLVFMTGASTAFSRTWRVKVSQIECSNLNRPPTDCVQYFTATSDTASSYNYPNEILETQNFSTCVRAAQGFCSIRWAEGSGTTDGFEIDHIALTDAETTTCPNAYVGFNSGSTSSATNMICGDIFNPVDGQTSNGNYVQQTTPFNMFFKSKTGQTMGRGYGLEYAQVPCT